LEDIDKVVKNNKYKDKNMKPKEIFLNGCNEIAKAFIGYGFKALKNGQLLRKVSSDNDINYEIYFQSSRYNSMASITVWPHFSISSKKLKKWKIEQADNENTNGLIYGTQIGYLSPHNKFKEWNLAGATFHKNVQEIISVIELYVVPIIKLFEDRNGVIDYLKTNGTQFNKWVKKSLTPLDFLIFFCGKEVAEIFLNDFIKSCKYGGRIKHYYNELMENENVVADFLEADSLKIAFKNGVKIRN
jgi:hypothetical protein